MNKFFNKVRKNRALALLLAFAMMLAILPFDTVHAEEAVAPSIDTTKTQYNGMNAVTEGIEGEFLAAATYTPALDYYPSVRVYPQNLDTSVYTKMVIEFTPSRDGMVLGINDNVDHVLRDHTAVSGTGKQTLVFDLNPEWDYSRLKIYADVNMEIAAPENPFIIHSVKFAKTPSIDTTKTQYNGMNAVTEGIEGEFLAAATYTPALDYYPSVRVYPQNLDTSVYTKMVIEFTPSRDGMVLGINDNVDHVLRDHTAVSGTGKKTLVFDLNPEWDYSRLKIYADVDLEIAAPEKPFIINDIKFLTAADPVPDTGSGDGSGNEGGNEGGEGGSGATDPAITINADPTKFTVVKGDDGYDVTYTAATGFNEFKLDVVNPDPTVYTKVAILVTPSAVGMNMGVYDQLGSSYPYVDHWGEDGIFNAVEKRWIECKLYEGSKGIVIYCDAANPTLSGQQTFKLHDFKLVTSDWVAPDPNAPEEIAVTLKWESGAAADDQGRLYVDTAGNFRGMIEFPATFNNVKVGKVLTINYETNLAFNKDAEFAYNNSGNVNGQGTKLTASIKSTESSLVIPITQEYADFFNNAAAASDLDTVRIRLKSNDVPAGKYFKLLSVTYGDAGAQYEPNQVPKGLVVTYYNDIYSRGVAWNTDDTVEENALYVVKATSGMTAEDVDWTDVEPVETTYKDTVSTDNTYAANNVYRTWKAHVEDLEPGATYFYRAGAEETGWSKVGSFTIEKAANEVTGLQFIHVTDSQEESKAGFAKWATVLADAYSRAPKAAFVAHTGDLVNNSGDEGELYMNEWCYVFDEPMKQIMNGVLAPSAGNHESNPYAFSDRFDIEWAQYYPDDDEEIKDYDILNGGSYVVTYGDDDLVVITLNNTAEAWDYENRFEPYQLPWMIEQLEKYSNYRFKVVQMHEGMMTAGDHTNDGECDLMRDELAPVFSKYKVDLVLQGHDHVYTRTRSYYYGDNPFEEGTQYYDGHTGIYLKPEVRENVDVNGEKRTLYVEPNGTHYVTINYCGSKDYPEEPADKLDKVILEGDNPINPKTEDGQYGCIVQPLKPMYGIITIQGDLLIYDSYTYDHAKGESTLYDTFAVDKSSIRGYNPDDPHEGKTGVELYGLEVPSKKYDGIPVELDISGFNCSDPRVMDCSEFKYTITVKSGGVDPEDGKRYTFNPGNLVYGHLPKEPGEYTLNIEIPQSNKDFWGETSIDFKITQ